MPNELAAQDGDSALKRRLARHARPHLLVIDEVGYLSYSNRHATYCLIARQIPLKKWKNVLNTILPIFATGHYGWI
ncbi:Mobile element protein [hydrothermal vent metagenome]|uniref:Mobile element protein n=1 Tax=hydrothermal vent metagenome TaxID=652676 RepID=A0A3B1BIH7_9ZZZZ